MKKQPLLLLILISTGLIHQAVLKAQKNETVYSISRVSRFSQNIGIEPGKLSLAQTGKSSAQKPAKSMFGDNSLSITGQWFLSYQTGEESDEKYNNFNLKRGYINIKKSLSNRISGRITQDISVDREGDGEGDIELRLKYCYLQYSLPALGFLAEPYVEFGLVHRPWIDFEEHINNYRVQGTMFLERNSILNSADYGITFISLLGGEMDDEYKSRVNESYPGKFGSLALGIYNGGGYHAIEKNRNKTLEGRLSLRPLPEILPGLQFSYHGVYGKGNIAFEPDWNFNLGFLSWEHPYFVLTGMVYRGKGNFMGTALTVSDQPTLNEGYSLFGEWKIPDMKLSILGRYDSFNPDVETEDWHSRRTIIGVAYHFIKGCKILVDYDSNDIHTPAEKNESFFEFAIEVHY